LRGYFDKNGVPAKRELAPKSKYAPKIAAVCDKALHGNGKGLKA
jgi:hypothetical protein